LWFPSGNFRAPNPNSRLSPISLKLSQFPNLSLFVSGVLE
jgi:hypothetical protein